MSREIRVRRLSDGFIARREDVSDWSDKDVSARIAFLLINSDTDKWVIEDSNWHREKP